MSWQTLYLQLREPFFIFIDRSKHAYFHLTVYVLKSNEGAILYEFLQKNLAGLPGICTIQNLISTLH